MTKPRTGSGTDADPYIYPILDGGTTKIGPITYMFKDASGNVLSEQTWDIERTAG